MTNTQRVGKVKWEKYNNNSNKQIELQNDTYKAYNIYSRYRTLCLLVVERSKNDDDDDSSSSSNRK